MAQPHLPAPLVHDVSGSTIEVIDTDADFEAATATEASSAGAAEVASCEYALSAVVEPLASGSARTFCAVARQ